MNEQDHDVQLSISERTILEDLGFDTGEHESAIDRNPKRCDFADGQGKCEEIAVHHWELPHGMYEAYNGDYCDKHYYEVARIIQSVASILGQLRDKYPDPAAEIGKQTQVRNGGFTYLESEPHDE